MSEIAIGYGRESKKENKIIETVELLHMHHVELLNFH